MSTVPREAPVQSLVREEKRGAELEESTIAITRSYAAIIGPDEDGIYAATVPAFPGVVDQGETEEEALEGVRQALDFTLTDMVKKRRGSTPGDAGRKVVREVDLAV